MIKLDTYLCAECKGISYVAEGFEIEGCPTCSEKRILKPLPPHYVNGPPPTATETKIEPPWGV
jgi:DNA-directed RNA polymerase subunit RPC12/RpoP